MSLEPPRQQLRKGISAAERLLLAEDLLERRCLVEAVAEFDRAEASGGDPDCCSGGRWAAAMLGGQFEAAWQESDAIRLRARPDPHRFWNGEDLRGKRVMVRCLHGFGDAVQHLRYAPRLRAIAEHVTFEVPPRMISLASMLDGVDDVITWGPDAHPSPEWDVQVEVTELPYVFRTSLAELPIRENFLRVPEELVLHAEKVMGVATKPRVGVVWASGEWNPSRSVSIDLFESLFGDERVEIWSLQGGSASEDVAQWVSTGRVRDAAICGDGLVALAAAIANMDLVLTVDTLAAHMAGAMGKATWVMLQRAADWRWMIDREDSPWYRSMRLLRQSTQGDWSGVVARVGTKMNELLNEAVAEEVPQ